jgi:hypothetical protein
MAHKKTTHSHTILLLLITLACICPIVNATQSLPQDPNNPYNNYTICSTDPYIAYTELFLISHPNNIDPTTEFKGKFYLNDKLNLTKKSDYTNPLYQYIAARKDYLAENPNSKITVKLKGYKEIEVATSYTNRDKYSIYPDELFLATNTHRDQNEPKPDNEITVYAHLGTIQEYSHTIQHNDLLWFGVTNPKYPNFIIDPLFGEGKIPAYSTQFINSPHYTEKTIQIDGYTYYKTNPDLETILDYIFTQPPQLINNPNSQIYLNIKDNGRFLNREVIAYSRKLTPDEINWYYNTHQLYTQNEIATKLHCSNAHLPDEILIAKTPGTDNQLGVFIKTETLKRLELGLTSNFKWISTYNENKNSGYWFGNGWLDTIYEPQ